MEYIIAPINALNKLFGELENIGSHMDYINWIKAQCNKFIDIIRDQDRQIQGLKAEIDMANSIFSTINTDVLHMRKSISQTKDRRYVEELV